MDSRPSREARAVWNIDENGVQRSAEWWALRRVHAALTSEDEIAHGEAWSDDKGGLGSCAYCNEPWPCRTQRGIDRLLAALPSEPPSDPTLDVERLRQAQVNVDDMNPLDWLNLGDQTDALAAEYNRLAALRTEPTEPQGTE